MNFASSTTGDTQSGPTDTYTSGGFANTVSSSQNTADVRPPEISPADILRLMSRPHFIFVPSKGLLNPFLEAKRGFVEKVFHVKHMSGESGAKRRNYRNKSHFQRRDRALGSGSGR